MKKYLLLLLLALSWCLPYQLLAVTLTADYLEGKIISQIFSGTLKTDLGYRINQNGFTWFEKLSDTQVKLHNFFQPGWDLIFNISNGQLVLQNDNATISNSQNGQTTQTMNYRTVTYQSGAKAIVINGDWYLTGSDMYIYKIDDTKWVGTLNNKTANDPAPYLSFPGLRIQLSTENVPRYMDKCIMYILNENSNQYYSVDGAATSTGINMVYVPTMTENNVAIQNLCNRGIVTRQQPWGTNAGSVTVNEALSASIDVLNKIDGTILLPADWIYDACSGPANYYSPIYTCANSTSTFQTDNYEAYVVGATTGVFTQATWAVCKTGYTDPNNADYTIYDDIEGTVHLHDPWPEGNQWSEGDGGTYKRYVQTDVTLEDFIFYKQLWTKNSTTYNGRSSITNWHCTIPKTDLTPTVSNDLARYGYGAEKGIYVGGKLTLGVNRQYFDHAELWLVPGRISSVSGRNDLDAATGLAGAINITEDYSWFRWNDTGLGALPNTFGDGHGSNPDWASQWPKKDRDWMAARLMAAPNTNGEIFYNHLVSPTELGWDAPADNAPAKRRVTAHNDYTVFAKVYYTQESGLQPTFHGLASSQQVTGIDDITVTPAADATELGHYDLQGRVIDATTPGVHIIRMSDGTARKSVVK